MSHDIIVSKEGYDATTAGVSGLAMRSELNLLKVKSTAKVTLIDGSATTAAHGLDYTPIVWVFYKKGDDLKPVYHDVSDIRAYVDGTNLVITNGNGWGYTYDFYYYIFYDEI